ncbi:MAG: hypothetical protein AB8G05_00400 [Oligoflexales bacterium]
MSVFLACIMFAIPPLAYSMLVAVGSLLCVQTVVIKLKSLLSEVVPENGPEYAT